ncbi:hypothetical protein BTS2_1915 [Bacillus sp. TS-2]|nr:hypothetical protein BTS2_1915 [Bacillus sp. TS-2]
MKRIVVLGIILSLFLIVSACGAESENVGLESEGNESTEVHNVEQTNEKNDAVGDIKPIEEESEEEIGEAYTSSEFLVEVDYLADYITDGFISLSQQGSEYLTNYLDLFLNPTSEMKQKAKGLVEEIDIKALDKDATPYLSTITSFTGYVVQIEEFDYGEGQRLTNAIISDDYSVYDVLLFGSSDGIYDEDYVTFYGLPMGKYAYDNVEGGHTISQFFLGSSIELAD